MHFLDVGQGDGAILRTPNGKIILVDAGRKSRGPEILDYLEEMGVQEIYAIAPSHSHIDHYEGFIPILESPLAVSEVWLTGQAGSPTWTNEFMPELMVRGLMPTYLKAGDERLVDGVGVQVLNPPNPLHTNNSEYNNSHVLRFAYGQFSILFTGDLHQWGEAQLLQRGHNPKSTILKISEHGSNHGSSETFLEAVAPRYALIGAGFDNQFDHPKPEVLARLDAVDAEAFVTKNHGTIVLRTNGTHLKIWRTKLSPNPYIDTPLVGLPSPTPFVDKDCPDFSTWQEAQAFFLANGGPSKDPHRLDNDRNGLACETLPGGPNS